jgi:inosose dehydratase
MALRPAVHTFNWIPWAHRQKVTLDIERVLLEVREAGFDAVEFSRVPMELDDTARTVRLLEKLGITLAGMSFTYKGLPGTWQELKDHARVLADLGGKAAVFFDSTDWQKLAPAGTDSGLHDTVQAAEMFAEFAATLGLYTAYHNHLRTNLETPAQIDAVVPKLKHAGFCIDTGHLIAAKGDPVAFIRRYASKIRHVHFKDTEFKCDGTIAEFVELGAGNHSYRVDDWLTALRETGYDGWLTVEQDQTKTTPFESARANRDWLRQRGV